MRKIREVLRLHHELGLGQRPIARSVLTSQSTVHDYLTRFASSGLSWPLPDELTDSELETRLFPSEQAAIVIAADPDKPLPDFATMRDQLCTNKNVTRQLLWDEYRQSHPDGYSYSWFCGLYDRWLGKQDLALRQEHLAGERVFVDWAGDKIAVHDPQTGEVTHASLFVAVLGASSYTYAEATRTEQTTDWIGAHIRAFEFFQGVPELLVPDNTKTAVSRPCRYDPDLNPTYLEMAKHYGAGVIPARVRKPKDKAKVEAGVLLAQRWILAVLRHQRFFSLAQLNQAIAPLLVKLNERPFQQWPDSSRHKRYKEIEKPALRLLPQQPYDMSMWSKAKVNIDYHIQVGHSFYSVPYALVQEQVDVRESPSGIEIFHNGIRVASHLRALKPNTAVTIEDHRPERHKAYLKWPPERILDWAATIGPFTKQAANKIMEQHPHPQMGYRSCLGLIRISERYSPARVEAAVQRVLGQGKIRLSSIESILRLGLDREPQPGSEATGPASNHDNIRGPEYFE